MRRSLLVSLLCLAVPLSAEAGRIHARGPGASDGMTLGFSQGQNDQNNQNGQGLALGHEHHSGGMVFTPPGPPPTLSPPGLGLGHGGFPRTRHGVHSPAPVPEPGTALMLLGGMLGLAWKSRARR